MFHNNFIRHNQLPNLWLNSYQYCGQLRPKNLRGCHQLQWSDQLSESFHLQFWWYRIPRPTNQICCQNGIYHILHLSPPCPNLWWQEVPRHPLQPPSAKARHGNLADRRWSNPVEKSELPLRIVGYAYWLSPSVCNRILRLFQCHSIAGSSLSPMSASLWRERFCYVQILRPPP